MTTNIQTIFVMLGQECNLACKYCIQRDIVKNQLCHKIDDRLLDWIEGIANNQERAVDVRFYGGEPLLFWQDITHIVEELERRKANVRFTTISNGKLLDQEKVDYLNAHGFGTGISWDGDNTIKTRGYDVIKEKKDLVLQLNLLTISVVISEYNYPLQFMRRMQELNDIYTKTHEYNIGLALEELNDVSDNNENLYPKDIPRVEMEMNILCQEVLRDNEMGHGFEGKRYWESPLYSFAQTMFNLSKQCRSCSYCGNGVNVQNVDLQGNLYLCHNTPDKKIGTIDDDFITLFRKTMELDNTKENYRDMCHNCGIEPLCAGGCMLTSKEIRHKYYCEMRRAIYRPIVNAIYAMLKQGERGLFANK